MAVEDLSIRLLLDHHMPPRLAHDLRREGFDVTYPRELGTERADDEEHPRWATAHGRAVVSSDLKDFPVIAERWLEQGRDHAEIILLPSPSRLTYGEILRRLRAFLDALTAEEMVNQIRWLDASWSARG